MYKKETLGEKDMNIMDERMIDSFLGEIKRQCEYVFMSVGILNSSLTPNGGGANATFYALENLISSLANISKILYPTEKYEERGEALRDKLEIKEDSEAFYSQKSETARKFRDILERYDEYFEEWYKEGRNNIIAVCNVGPRNNIIDEKAASYLRHYDNTKASFIFFDEEYSILPIIKETDEIYNKILNIEKEKFKNSSF
ncbi:hypothetical protein [Clostridium isatidis]|uniref:hypothetical protein n=1 Tax=Clostridium isatidis TaxID=182773 RepID=UPI003AAF3C42